MGSSEFLSGADPECRRKLLGLQLSKSAVVSKSEALVINSPVGMLVGWNKDVGTGVGAREGSEEMLGFDVMVGETLGFGVLVGDGDGGAVSLHIPRAGSLGVPEYCVPDSSNEMAHDASLG